MKSMIILVVVMTSIFQFSCTPEDMVIPDSPEVQPVDIRFRNTSDYVYSNVLMRVINDSTKFVSVAVGETTDYKNYEKSYSYDFISLEIDGVNYTIQPIDWVGESYLEEGKYTFEVDALDVTTNDFPLIFTLVED